MALVKSGADRQAMHEKLRQHALQAWAAVQAGQTNPLADRLAADLDLRQYLPEVEIRLLMDASQYVGDAPQRARSLAAHFEPRSIWRSSRKWVNEWVLAHSFTYFWEIWAVQKDGRSVYRTPQAVRKVLLRPYLWRYVI